MWIKTFCLGAECWQKGNNLLTITRCNQWEVEVNNKRIGSSPDKDKTYEIAYNYMEKN